ncbi:MAG TPA: sensor histidine kinase [Bacilli bacterium]
MGKLKIKWKIAILSFCIVFFALTVGGTILLGRLIQLHEHELGQRLLTTARTVAQMPEIIENIGGTNPSNKLLIQSTVERIRIVNNADYIVVMDMEGVRWSHPNNELIGTPSKSLDEGSSFTEHTYISKAKGELGTSLRAFVPIMNDMHEQIGVVLVGQLLPTIWENIVAARSQLYVTFSLSLLFGIWGSWLLGNQIKRQMFELEPHEIARMLTERTAAFQAMHEGVIVIDGMERITIFNKRAMQMLNISGDVIGRKLSEIVPESRLPEILQLEQPLLNQEIQIGAKQFMSSRIPIQVNGATVGAIAIFQDRTEVKQMAEELTGVREFVNALRVQNHEHINKLHTIGGLIQLDMKEKALEYVFHLVEQQGELTEWLASHIHDANLSGLLLGKISRGKELGIDVQIDRRSKLHSFPSYLDHHDFVVLTGNLIENAFDAMRDQEGEKRLFVSFEQDEEVCSIMVEDNGCGISPELKERIFEKGFTTKKGNVGGLGLHLVKSIVDKGKGSIQIDSAPGRGTTIIITLPMRI